MSPWLVWALFALFVSKHYYADFPLQQNPYTWQHKHEYWHPGGWVHALVHGFLTFWVLAVAQLYIPAVGLGAVMLLSLADTVVHHHIDWWKMNKNRRMGWKPDTHAEFWVLLGQDQLCHNLTYASIIAVLLLIA